MPENVIESRPPEERILICNNEVFLHHERTADSDAPDVILLRKVYRPCGNLMKILVSFDAAKTVSQIQCLDIDQTKKRGAYISRRWKQKWGSRHHVYKYGPRHVRYFSFLHCSACNQRWHWKRFVKADV